MLNKLMYKSLGTLGFLLKVLAKTSMRPVMKGWKIAMHRNRMLRGLGTLFVLLALVSSASCIPELDRSVVGIDCVTDDDCDAGRLVL